MFDLWGAFRTSAGMGKLPMEVWVAVLYAHKRPVAGIVPSISVSPHRLAAAAIKPLHHPIALWVVGYGVASLHPKGIQRTWTTLLLKF